MIALDLIGFGHSDKPADWEAHTFTRQATWLDQPLQTPQALQIRNSIGFLFD